MNQIADYYYELYAIISIAIEDAHIRAKQKVGKILEWGGWRWWKKK